MSRPMEWRRPLSLPLSLGSTRKPTPGRPANPGPWWTRAPVADPSADFTLSVQNGKEDGTQRVTSAVAGKRYERTFAPTPNQRFA